MGYHIGGPYHKDNSIFGSMLACSNLRKLPYNVAFEIWVLQGLGERI